jgi:hypothetical protein
MEVLQRINKQSLLFAQAVMHTTGQAFMMAFQAGGPHARTVRSKRSRMRGRK